MGARLPTGRIYLITNRVNGKHYVGQTHYSLADRWAGHVNDAHRRQRRHITLGRAIRKYGKEAFLIEELEGGFESQCELNAAEVRWVAELKTCQDVFGYNIRGGGNQGLRSPESIARSSATHKLLWADPEYRARVIESFKRRWAKPEEHAKASLARSGIKRTLESRAQQSARQRGSKHTEAAKAKIAASNHRRKYSPATISKLRTRTLEQMQDPQMRERLLLSHTGRKAGDATRAKMRVAHLGLKATEATKAKLRASKLGGKKTIEQRANMRISQVLRRANYPPSKVPARNLCHTLLPIVAQDLFLNPGLLLTQSTPERNQVILAVLACDRTKALQWLARVYGAQAINEAILTDNQNAQDLPEAIRRPWLHALERHQLHLAATV